MGLISLLVGPIVAATVTAVAASRPVSEHTVPAGNLVERTGHSVLSVGHVVAVRAAEPAAFATPPAAPPLGAGLPSPIPGLIAPAAVPAILAPAVTAPAPTPTPTPTPTPAPTPKPKVAAADVSGPSAPAGSVEQTIMDAAAKHGVDGRWMIRIARCESGLNTRAYNPAGPWIGLYQFAPATFRGHGGTDIYSAEQQANIAASMLANGQAHQWPVCSLR